MLLKKALLLAFVLSVHPGSLREKKRSEGRRVQGGGGGESTAAKGRGWDPLETERADGEGSVELC